MDRDAQQPSRRYLDDREWKVKASAARPWTVEFRSQLNERWACLGDFLIGQSLTEALREVARNKIEDRINRLDGITYRVRNLLNEQIVHFP